MKHEKFKVTPLERAWILYDVGNSAFVLMIATLVPIFFNALAEAGGLSSVDYLAYWGYASSVVTVITAVLGPILGTLADTKGFKKPIFMLCLFVGVAGCCAMGLATTWLPFLIIFILAKIGFSGSLVFYDSMLGAGQRCYRSEPDDRPFRGAAHHRCVVAGHHLAAAAEL